METVTVERTTSGGGRGWTAVEAMEWGRVRTAVRDMKRGKG